jgi:ribosomal protein S18 acetylase RimI-like enzyme
MRATAAGTGAPKSQALPLLFDTATTKTRSVGRQTRCSKVRLIMSTHEPLSFTALTPTAAELERKLLEWHTWYELTFLDRTTDPVRMKAFSELVSTSTFNELGPRWHLAFIGVSPRHQRQGVGKLLVERGQKLAREEGLPLTLEASVPGRGLYAKLGFKTVGEVRVSEEIRNPMMLWEPEERQGRWLEDIGNGEAKMRVDGKADSRVELVS